MQNNAFCQNLNSLFSIKAPELRFDEDEVYYGFVVDDNENKIHTFPIIEYEERYLSLNDSESYTYLSICSYGQCTDVVRIKSSNLFNANTFISKFGNKPFASFNDNSWTMFFTTIKVMLPEIEQRVVYQYSGWNKELDKYLFGNLLIDANNILPIQTTLVKTDTLLSDKKDAEVCQNIDNITKHISSNQLIGYIFLIYLLSSHCNQRFIQLYRSSFEFVLSITGATNSYKTSTSRAFFNTNDGSVSSFEDSFASIRRMFQANKSGVIIVDDYKISSSLNDEKYEKIVRLSGDAQTTGKYVAGNKVVDELITGMSVITGEKRPQLQQSSYSRILFVDLERFPITLNFLTSLQSSKADINSFVVLFVQYIIKNDDFDKKCVDLFKKYRDELLQDTEYKGMHGRYYGMYGWLAAMWDMYIEFLHQYDVCAEFDFKTEIKAHIYSQHCMYDNNPVKLFKTGYTELLNSNELTVVDNNAVDGLNFDVIQYDDKLFLKSNAVYKKVYKLWADKGIDFSCSERKLRHLLYEAGILETRNGKYTIEKKTKDNRSYSGYYLLKNIFMNYGGSKDEEF
ncbi:MAG: hypothetical protein IJ365_01860 [Clostridia bacterium]|nr:hypothetical protein [Clostridia bacterium]